MLSGNFTVLQDESVQCWLFNEEAPMESIEKFGAYTRGLDPTSGALGIYTETNLRNVAVNCRFCGNKIPFVKPERLGSEIGLKCPKCERRMIYAAAEVYPFGGPTKTQATQPGVGLLARLFG